MELFNLKGKTALVTGASKGIGARCAEVLSYYGANVILTARNEDDLLNIVKTIRLKGGNADYCLMDVSSQESIKNAVKFVENKGFQIDILINNAGVSLMTPVFGVDSSNEDDAFEVQVSTNLLGVWYVTKFVARHMKSHNVSGSIINIASVCGANRLRANLAGYCATKAAVIQLTKALVGELSSQNIRINCISPGLFHTPLNDDRVGDPGTRKEIEKTIPVNFVANTDDIDGAILYFASNNASRYVTGSCLTVDGGASWGGVYDFYTFKNAVY